MKKSFGRISTSAFRDFIWELRIFRLGKDHVSQISRECIVTQCFEQILLKWVRQKLTQALLQSGQSHLNGEMSEKYYIFY